MQAIYGRGEQTLIKSTNMKFLTVGSAGNPDMEVIKRNVCFGGKVKVITYRTGPRLCDKPWHPFETYIIMHMDGMFDSATVSHRTKKEALAFHKQADAMIMEAQHGKA